MGGTYLGSRLGWRTGMGPRSRGIGLTKGVRPADVKLVNCIVEGRLAGRRGLKMEMDMEIHTLCVKTFDLSPVLVALADMLIAFIASWRPRAPVPAILSTFNGCG